MISWSKKYNCASWAIERINELHKTEITVSDYDCWQSQFIPFMRKLFKPVGKPVEGCLVVMKGLDGTMHLGVYESFMVRHNYKAHGGAGSLISSDLGTIRAEFDKRIRFYVVN
ncbi:hypothetical protein NVP1236O_29 [Vibrio phage 1.236.O._10N.261.52.C4]|nr:hypothetical protein NVP1178O_33 [Vibrio phage 1.178.O._10N.286.45.E12]AUR97021.1 hypothetical protein NVP1236O_29 [Vibrio phage 1.236.O._10N.261.52.C4]